MNKFFSKYKLCINYLIPKLVIKNADMIKLHILCQFIINL